MDILIITVLIIAAVILFLVELFVIPGISLAGISALVCIIYANYYAFANLGMAAGFITLGISGVACIGSLVWFMRSKMLDKLALKKDIDSKVDRSAEDSVKVGDTGIAYLYAILCTTVYLRINVFFQSQFVEHFRPHEPDERPDTGYS